MSTHRLDASGSRALTTTINDPARTVAVMNAKSGDDVVATFGNFEYIEIQIPTTAGAVEIITRGRVDRVTVLDQQGNPVRDPDGKIRYEDREVKYQTLRLRSYVALSAHTRKETLDSIPQTPHTDFRVANLENSGTPMWLTGDVLSEEKIDLGFGI